MRRILISSPSTVHSAGPSVFRNRPRSCATGCMPSHISRSERDASKGATERCSCPALQASQAGDVFEQVVQCVDVAIQQTQKRSPSLGSALHLLQTGRHVHDYTEIAA